MKSFEDAISELKVIIEKLEGGNLSLEESLTLFEKGTQLINLCHKKLNEVEKRIEIFSGKIRMVRFCGRNLV